MSAQPYPSEPDWWLGPFKDSVKALYDQAGVPLDENYPVWFGRTAYDICAGMTKEASQAKHLNELAQALGIVGPVPPLPSKSEWVKKATGNFCGIRLSGHDWPYDALFDPVYTGRDDGTRAAIRSAHLSRGHSVMVVQPKLDYPGYPSHDQWQDLDVFRARLLEWRQAGGTILLFLGQDDADAYRRIVNTDDARWLAEAVKDLVSGVCAGWEFTPQTDPADWLLMAAELRQLFPDAWIGTHWTPERVGPEANPPYWTNEPGFWAYVREQNLVDGLLYQTPHGSQVTSGNGWQPRVVEVTDRLVKTPPVVPGWPQADVVMFESIAYDFSHRADVIESRGVEIGQQAKGLRCIASLNG